MVVGGDKGSRERRGDGDEAMVSTPEDIGTKSLKPGHSERLGWSMLQEHFGFTKDSTENPKHNAVGRGPSAEGLGRHFSLVRTRLPVGVIKGEACFPVCLSDSPASAWRSKVVAAK